MWTFPTKNHQVETKGVFSMNGGMGSYPGIWCVFIIFYPVVLDGRDELEKPVETCIQPPRVWMLLQQAEGACWVKVIIHPSMVSIHVCSPYIYIYIIIYYIYTHNVVHRYIDCVSIFACVPFTHGFTWSQDRCVYVRSLIAEHLLLITSLF